MIALDTNIFIYACDKADPTRQQIALDLISNTTDGVMLWQVACEFIVATRKLEPGICAGRRLGAAVGLHGRLSFGDTDRRRCL